MPGSCRASAAPWSPRSPWATPRAVADAQRGWAIGVFAAGGTSLLVFGALLAGVLLEVASWRWIFLVTLPVLGFAVITGWRTISVSRGAPPPSSGNSLLTLVRDPMLTTSLAVLFAIQFAVFGVTVPLTLYLQHALALGPGRCGCAHRTGIGTPLFSVATGRLADRWGPRALVVPGLALACVALLALALLSPLGRVAVLVPGLLGFALARPVVFTPAGAGPFIALGGERRAFAASLATEARQLGAVVGVAVAGAVFSWVNGVSLVDGDVALVQGFRAAVLVAAAVSAVGTLAAWLWMPTAQRTSTGS